MKTIDKSGNRLYVFETVKNVPSIKRLITNAESNINFINSVTLNPKSENAELYSDFSFDTYRSFLYAFAYQAGHLNPTSCVAFQFEMNARRFDRLCKKRGIVLSESEMSIINYCKTFKKVILTHSERVSFSNNLIKNLIELYS